MGSRWQRDHLRFRAGVWRDNQVYVVTRAGRGKAWGTPRRLTYFTIVVRRATWAMELAWK